MKIFTAICRILLGLMFVVFGLNGFLFFIPQPPPPPGLAGQFTSVMSESHYLVPVFALQLAGGFLLLINRFVPLGLVFLGPILVNILIFHTLLAPEGIVPGLVVTALWFVVFYSVRFKFSGIFAMRT